MSFGKAHHPDTPVCKKHGYIGYNCTECFYDKYAMVDREKYINALSVMRSVMKKAGLVYEPCDILIEELKRN